MTIPQTSRLWLDTVASCSCDTIDLFGRLCSYASPDGPADIPMADYNLCAYLVWGALAETLERRGWSETDIIV